MKYALIGLVVLTVLGLGGFFLIKKEFSSQTPKTPTTVDEPVKMLSAEQQPKVSLSFKSDGHFVTVMLSNLHASSVEYNLIYDAKIKRNGITSQVNTGVTGSAKVEGKMDYSKDELLGSESSGHLTFHENIQNASMELTLRDDSGRSIFTAKYPFIVQAGKVVELTTN